LAISSSSLAFVSASKGDVGLADGADGEPAKAAELGEGDVVAKLEAELVNVEGERLVLVVDPDVDVAQLLDGHACLRWWDGGRAKVDRGHARVFSKAALFYGVVA
jgi:hypothetical protein